MKKLLILLAGMFLFISCEKWEFRESKLNGTYVSNSFKLADLDSVKISLNFDDEPIINMSFDPKYFGNKYLFKVDSISKITHYFNHTIYIVYFHSEPRFIFESNPNFKSCYTTHKYHGTLEVKETYSKLYRLIGYLDINNRRWRDTLYFN